MRNFAAFPFFILCLLTAISKPAHSQLFIERYGIKQIDLKYFWAAGLSNLHIPNEYPLRQPFVDSYLNDSIPIPKDSDPYGTYLKELYQILYGMEPQTLTEKTHTRRLIERLGFHTTKQEFFGYHANLYEKYDGDLILGINPIFRYDVVHDETFRSRSITIQSHGIETWLTWKKQVGAYVRFFDTVQRGMKYYGGRQDIYEPYAGYVAVDKQSISYDQTIAYIGYSGSLFSARIGRGKHQWGPGIYHNLLLSEQHPPYDYVELRFHYGDKIYFTYLHGNLDPAPLGKRTIYYNDIGNARNVKPRKYFAAHRIEFIPSNWLSVGFSEEVIYGDRNVELGYVIPVNIFWSEGHDDRYNDNVLWSFDTEFKLRKGLTGYGELLLDDISVSKFGTSSFVNKTGYLGGLRWIHPLGLSQHEWLIEYTRLRPFVYTHWFDINIPSHYGYNLGSILPPNSDELRTSWKFHMWPDFTVDLYTIIQRHGSTPEGQDPVGGSIFEKVGGNIKIKEHYPFLDGKREDLREIGLQGNYRVLERLELNVLWGIGKYINKNYNRFSVGLFWNY